MMSIRTGVYMDMTWMRRGHAMGLVHLRTMEASAEAAGGPQTVSITHK